MAMRAFHASGAGRRRLVQNWEFRLREMFRERVSARLASDGCGARGAAGLAARNRPIYQLSMTGLDGISIDHLGVAVSSIDEALPFYLRTFTKRSHRSRSHSN